MEEEYELVPLSPLRQMEKRVEKIERSGAGNEMIKELIDVVKTNQKIVDDIVKVNSEMINRVSELTNTVGKTISKIDEFIGNLEVVGSGDTVNGITEEKVTPISDNVSKRLEKMEKRLNALILSSMVRKPMQKRPLTM